uniref:Uncharacterized protein n=1 Tax=viral metagenome TaxID=1070528 RepID=A0A6C0CA60_9ZZZZ
MLSQILAGDLKATHNIVDEDQCMIVCILSHHVSKN